MDLRRKGDAVRAMRVVGALVMVVSVLTPGTSDVAEAQTTTAGLCDAESVTQFSDVRAGEYGAEYIRCMKALGLSLGKSDGSYGPDSQLTRAQMASFLVRLWRDVLGKRCPKAADTPFTDVAGNTHEESIGCLYGLEIAKGTTTVTYGPGEKLKVTQISRFLVRLYEKAGNSCGVAGDGLERAVKCLAAFRVIPSAGEGSSFGLVTRDQMAVYLVGLWHNMVGRGLPPRPPTKPDAGTYTTVSAGSNLSCGVRSEGAGECWGNDEFGQLDTPDGLFRSVSAGGEHACGLLPDGTVRCWGNHRDGRLSVPAGLYTSVSAGGEHTCAVRTDETIECWGSNASGQANTPGGRYISVSAGRYHSCGLRTDGAVRCWGKNDDGQAKDPAGKFISVSAGGEHSCGLLSGGTIECWGNNGLGQADAPDGLFISVSAGGEHSCGVRTSRAVTCWGWNKFTQLNAPDLRFSAVSAGRFHTCGLRTNHVIRCWGNNRFGEAEAPGG